MRRICILFLAAAAFAEQDLPGAFEQREREAFEFYYARMWPEAVAGFERQIAVFADNPRPYYNIACCHALAGDAERAGVWLQLAIARGWRDRAHLLADPDFAAMRETGAFRAALGRLDAAIESDPDPLPRWRMPGEAPSFASAGSAQFVYGLRERAALDRSTLLERNQIRRQIFPVYDEAVAALGRYLAENGDARDAGEAAYARVEVATRYLDLLEEGDADARNLAIAIADHCAEEFLRGWAGSDHLGEVRLIRARLATMLGRDARAGIRSLVEDLPAGWLQAQARIELCAQEADFGDATAVREVFRPLQTEWSDREDVQLLMRRRLGKAFLISEGMPVDSPAAAGAKAVLYLFVRSGDGPSEARLAAARDRQRRQGGAGLRTIAVCVDPKGSEVAEQRREEWLRLHAEGLESVPRGESLAERMWVEETPLALLATAGGELLAYAADDATIDKALPSQGG